MRKAILKYCIYPLALVVLTFGLLISCQTETSSAKEITSFKFLKENNTFLGEDAIGVFDLDNRVIYVDMPHSLPCHEYELVATFSITGNAMYCNDQNVGSGVTALCYLPWPTFTVTAEDGSSQDYTVKIRQGLDAFVANMGQANKVWLNNGSGNYSDSGQTLGSSASYGVALGDLDGDGDLDAFVANRAQANTVWLNNGSGNYSDSGQTLGSSTSYGVALGDLDGDGDLDAFVANDGPANTVWLNNGSGNYSDSGQTLGSSDSFGVALGDLDGDGDLDAFVAIEANQANKVWMNNGSGNYSDSGQTLGSSISFGVALGDLDGNY